MLKKMIYLILVLLLVNSVQAGYVRWTDTTGDHNWFTADNWDIGAVPTSGDLVPIDLVPGPIIATEGAVVDGMWVGGGESGTAILTVDGGSLTALRWLTMAEGVNSTGTVNMISGSITISGLFVGQGGEGTLNMTGGTITAGDFWIANFAQATGHVNLDGGVITSLTSLVMRSTPGSVGTMNVTAGTLVINGNRLSIIQGYIDNGWITAYSGQGVLNLDYDETEDKTTLTATHLLEPNPVDGSTVAPGAVELSWTLPDPSMSVDVYFTDDLQLLQWFTDPAAIQFASKQNMASVVVQTQPKTWYYWAVDTYVGDPNDPVFGPIFSFYADNLPPQVDAGADVAAWLEDGPRTGNLDATVTDNEACSVLWTVVSEPNTGDAVIETADAEDTSITLSAVGEYVLQLEASDGEYTSSDTVTINVYNDNCEAAQSVPDYVPLVGDLNGDCKVDDADMVLLEENWLKDNSLTDGWFVL